MAITFSLTLCHSLCRALRQLVSAAGGVVGGQAEVLFVWTHFGRNYVSPK